MKKILVLMAVMVMAITSVFAVPTINVTASTTPATTNVEPGMVNVNLFNVNLTISGGEDVMINQIILNVRRQQGENPVNNMINFTMKKPDGAVILTSPIMESTGEVYFNLYNNALLLLSGQTQQLLFYADIIPEAEIGDQIGLEIPNHWLITGVGTQSGLLADVVGEFPIQGNLIPIEVDDHINVYINPSDDISVSPGAENVELLVFNLTAIGTSNFRINSLEFAAMGMMNDIVYNCMWLEDYQSGQLISDIHINANTGQFTLPNYYINAGQSRSIALVANINDVDTDMTYYATFGFPNAQYIQGINLSNDSPAFFSGDFPMYGHINYFWTRPSWLSSSLQRDPITVWNGNNSQVQDTIYVLPGQNCWGSSWMNATQEIVGVQYHEFHSYGMFLNVYMANEFPTPGSLMSSYGEYLNEFSWMSDSTGTNNASIAWFGFINESTENKYIIQDLETNYMYWNGMYHWPTTTHHSINLSIITSTGKIGDFDGNDIVNHSDVNLLQASFLNGTDMSTLYNPAGEYNIARTRVLFPYDTFFHAILLNWWVNNPNNSYVNYLGIGQSFTFDSFYQSAPATWQQNSNNVVIDTQANCLGIFWINSDGSQGSQVMLFEGNQCRNWTNSIEPTVTQMSRDNVEFQLPEGARLLDVQARELDMSTSMDELTTPVPQPNLGVAYPNPFRSATSIGYSLPKAGNVTIEVYNIKGQKVRTLVSETKSSGNYRITWNGTDDNNRSIATGVYFYKMKSGSYTSTKKVILVK